MFQAGIKRFVNPHQYPVGLELGLHERKTKLILKAQGVRAATRSRLRRPPCRKIGENTHVLLT